MKTAGSVAEVRPGAKKSLNPLEVSRGMRQSILAGMFGSCFAVCIALQFLTGFATALGASDIQIALLISLPMLGMSLQIFSTLLTQHLRERKPYWFWLATLHRLIWIPIATIPFFLGHSLLGAKPALTIFLILFSVSSILGSMSAPLWLAWMADLVPKEQTGKFWGRRVALISLINIFAIPLGWFVDHFPKNDPLPYALLFLLAGIVGQVDILIHKRVVEPPVTPGEPKSFLKLAREPFQHGDFRRLLSFSCFWHFAVFFADGFVIYFFLEKMGLSQSFVAMAISMMWIVRWVMARYWGFLGDRFGHAAVLRVCSTALVFWPLALIFWGYSHPKSSLLGVHVYMGFFNVGFETAFTALLLGVTPAQNKSLYVSVLHASAGLVAAVAPLLGGAFLKWSSHNPSALGPFDQFQCLFFLGMMLRLISVLASSWKFQEIKGGSSPAMLIRRLMDTNPFKVIHHSYVLNEGIQESQRVDAVYELADAGSAIASEQLIQALRDPSLDVRRGAVRALVEIGERTSLPELLAAARSPETQIQSEAIEAIGRMGDRAVTPCLLSFLEDPALRLPALRSLGDLRDPSSLDSLRDWSRSLDLPPAQRAAALEACCNLGDATSIMPCLTFMRQCNHELLRWQAAIALARMTLEPIDFYSVLQQELRIRGDMVSAQIRRSPVLRGKSAPLRKIAGNLIRKSQQNYLDGNWREASLGFTLAALACMEIVSPSTAEETLSNRRLLPQTLKPLEKTVSELAVTRSRLVLSLRLAEALLKMEGDVAQTVSEEAILAYCFLRKLLGSA